MIVHIKVYPSSSKQELVKISETEYKAYLKKPAEDNKANIELLKLLKHELGKQAKIIKGLHSKNKIIEMN